MTGSTTATMRDWQTPPQLKHHEFVLFRDLMQRRAGIHLADVKAPLVSGRLAKRLKHYALDSFDAYFRLISTAGNQAELQTAIDLLTTNETYFFREPKHMDFLARQAPALRQAGRPFRLWSAASSSGEEAYSLAMVLAEAIGDVPWEIIGSDISTRVLETAASGHYPLTRIEGIPRQYLERYCLKGYGEQEGTFLIDRALRNRVHFRQINLNETLPQLGEFDFIFLRNVMIYFDQETKVRTVARMLPLLRPGGYFIVSHSETLNGICDALEMIVPSIYRKPS